MGNGRRFSTASIATIHFPPFAGMIFKKTSYNMRMWFYAIHLIINDKRGFQSVNDICKLIFAKFNITTGGIDAIA